MSMGTPKVDVLAHHIRGLNSAAGTKDGLTLSPVACANFAGELTGVYTSLAELIADMRAIRQRAVIAEASGVLMRGALRNIIEQVDASLDRFGGAA